ncbi:MAG: hypothetical protein ACE5GE_06170 [Phycisphaerae bacterium]
MFAPHTPLKVSLTVVLGFAFMPAPAVCAQGRPGGPASSDQARPGGHGRGRSQSAERAQRGGRGGGPGRAFFDRFSDEERAEVRRFLEAHFPDHLRAMRRMEQRGSKGLRGQFGQLMPRIFRLMEEYENDEEAGELGIEELKLEFKIRKRAHQYQSERSTQRRETLRGEISEFIAQRFDVHQKRARLQIERLELRLEDLKRRVAHRQESREQVVQQEVDAVLLPPGAFGGGPPPDRGPDARRDRGPKRRGGPRRDRP